MYQIRVCDRCQLNDIVCNCWLLSIALGGLLFFPWDVCGAVHRKARFFFSLRLDAMGSLRTVDIGSPFMYSSPAVVEDI